MERLIGEILRRLEIWGRGEETGGEGEREDDREEKKTPVSDIQR